MKIKIIGLIGPIFYKDSYPKLTNVELWGIACSNLPGISPETQSRATFARSLWAKSYNFESNSSSLISSTWVILYDFSNYSLCSYFLTIQITSKLYNLKSRKVILPSWLTGPVRITQFAFNSLHLSKSPTAVRGLIKEQAPFSKEV